MSISNLFTKNDYTLNCKEIYCDNIILPYDTNGVVTIGCGLYSRTGTSPNYTYTLQRGGITLYYSVHKNGLFLFMKSSTGEFQLSTTTDRLYLLQWDPETEQPLLPWHIPYEIISNDGDMCYVINFQNGNNTTCRMRIDTNSAGVPGDFYIYLEPHSPNGGVSAGSFVSGVNTSICNFFITAPVQYVG